MPRRESTDDLMSDIGGPASNFQSQAAEGDIMAKQGEFRKAIDSYTRALNYRAGEKNTLIARSRCYLALGDAQSALDDANAVLEDDPDFFKARFQKAEALYAKSDFEMALVFYHRGYQARPDLDEFRLGVQKAREAIDNSIGSGITPLAYRSQVERNIALRAKSGSSEDIHFHGHDDKHDKSKMPDRDAKQLLEELFVDKEYLEALLDDRDFQINPNNAVRELVIEGLNYLDSRIDFWRQQKPIYTRHRSGSSAPKPAAVSN